MGTDHRARAAALRAQVGGSGGRTEAGLRRTILAQVAGGPAAPAPHGALVAQIAAAPHGVTDAQVAAVRAVAGSDRAAFEIVMTAAIGSGLMRWDRAMRALEEADDAAG